MTEIVGFFIACVAVLTLSVMTRNLYGRADAIALSVCLCGSWLVSKMIAHDGNLWLTFSTRGNWEAARQAYPTIDAVIMTIVVFLCVQGRAELWKIGVGSTIFTKLAIDLIYAYAGLNTGIRPDAAYQVMMNAGFALEIAFVSCPGGWALANHYRRNCLLDRSRRLGRLPSRSVAPSP